MRNIIEAATEMIDLLEITWLDFAIDFRNVAHNKLEERISNYGWPVYKLETVDPNQHIFQVSNLIVEVERTSYTYLSENNQKCFQQIVGVSMFGIDSDNECEPYELGDINEFGVEKVAHRMRDQIKIEFCAEKVRVWMKKAQVIAC